MGGLGVRIRGGTPSRSGLDRIFGSGQRPREKVYVFGEKGKTAKLAERKESAPRKGIS